MTGVVPSPGIVDYGVMIGATSGVAGVQGQVPQPAAGDEAKVLLGDGTWGSNATTPGFPGTVSGGTSGGVPYFNSSTTWAASAALTQYLLITGGGAGNPPVTSIAIGTSGQVLKSNGAGALPSFQTIATGITIGDTVTSGTTGSVLYVGTGPVLAQDNTNLFYGATLLNSGPGLRIGSGSSTSAGATIGYAGDVNSGTFAIHSTAVTRSSQNYTLAGGATFTELNVPTSGTIYIGVNGAASQTITATLNTMGQPVSVTDATDASSSTTGSLKSSGGAGFVKNIFTAAGVTAWSGTAIPAGGTAGSGIKVSSTSNFGVFFGSGAPTLSAAKGSLYLRSDGTGVTDRAYINTDAGTTWTAIATAG